MKNIVCLDVETTGLNREIDRIIQLSCVKIKGDTYEYIDTFDTYILPDGNFSITLQAFSKHKILPKDLIGKPMFKDISNKLLNFINGCDLLGYNIISFDLPILKNEFKRCEIDWNFSKYTIYDSFLEEKRRNSNTLENTFKRYYNISMEDKGYYAHNSLSDVKATIDIFKAQNKNMVVPKENIIDDDMFIRIDNFFGKNTYVFCYGKYANISIEYVAKNDKGYLIWVIQNNKFGEKTKKIIESFINN